MITSTTGIILCIWAVDQLRAPLKFGSNLVYYEGETRGEINKQGMNELRYRNRSEDDNTPMLRTLNNHPSYSTSGDMQSCSDDTWPPTNSQAYPFLAPNRTVFEVFSVRGASVDQYSVVKTTPQR